MKNKPNISLVLAVISIITTVFLFYYWTNEENRTSLFNFNLAYTIFLEILFFGFIFFSKLNSNKILGATYSILGTILSLYLFFGVTVLLSFNIILLDIISIKWYFTSIIAGTLLTIIIYGFSLKLNNNLIRSTHSEANITKSRDSFVQSLNYLQSIYANILVENRINEKLESGYSSIIQKLTNKVSFINPKIIEDTNHNMRLSDSIGNLDHLIKEMRNSGNDKISIQKQITELVDDTIFYLNSIK